MAHYVHARRRGDLGNACERDSGSITARADRSRQWLMPVLTRMDSTSSTHIAVLSDPVPAVVGTAISGLSGSG